MSHSMAEIHGCGDAAKSHARAEWLQHSGPKPGVKTNADVKRKLLENKLKKKLDNVTKDRKAQPKKQ